MEFRKKKVTCLFMAAWIPLVAAMTSSVALAILLTAGIDGNTVKYTVSGADPNGDYIVEILHDDTNQSNQYDEKADPEGKFKGSGTPGDSPIDPGDSVTVNVYDAENPEAPIHSEVFKKDEDENAPWWAYTIVGTAYYLVFGK